MLSGLLENQRWRSAAPFLALAALPLVLLAFNGSWLWDSTYYHDTNVYIAFFRRYLDFTLPFTENYKLSRLPFVLPGVLFYALFPPGFAHHLLHLVFLIGEAWLVFGLTRRRYGGHAAFVAAAAVLVLTYSHILPSYHNQAASMYFVAAVALLELPTRWSETRRMLLAGAVFALAVTTDTIVGTLLPVFALRAFVLSSQRTVRRLGLNALLGLTGGVAALAALGALNAALGGPFLFFMEQVRYSIGIAELHSMSQLDLRGMLRRFGDFPQLVFPLASVFAGLLLLVTRAIQRRLDFSVLEAVSVLMTMAIAAAQQEVGLMTVEEPCLFHPFFAPMFLAFPALFAWNSRELPLRPGRRFLVAVPVLLSIPLVFFGESFSQFVADAARAWPSMVYGVPLALGIALLASWEARRRSIPVRMGILAGAFGLMNALSAAREQPAYLYQAGAECPFRREGFYAVLEGDELFTKFDFHTEARWKTIAGPRVFPEFDGTSWCRILPVETVARNALLTRYFHTSDELLHGLRYRPLKKIAITATTPAHLKALHRDVTSGIPANAKTTITLDRELKYSTFTLFLRGYDITLPEK